MPRVFKAGSLGQQRPRLWRRVGTLVGDGVRGCRGAARRQGLHGCLVSEDSSPCPSERLEALGSLRGGVLSQPSERSTSRCGDPPLGSGAVVRLLRTDHLWPWAPPHSHLRGRVWTL